MNDLEQLDRWFEEERGKLLRSYARPVDSHGDFFQFRTAEAREKHKEALGKLEEEYERHKQEIEDQRPKKWHVHVYDTPRLAEVEVEAANEQDASAKALQFAKDGMLDFDQESPTKWLAMAFLQEEEEEGTR